MRAIVRFACLFFAGQVALAEPYVFVLQVPNVVPQASGAKLPMELILETDLASVTRGFGRAPLGSSLPFAADVKNLRVENGRIVGATKLVEPDSRNNKGANVPGRQATVEMDIIMTNGAISGVTGTKRLAVTGRVEQVRPAGSGFLELALDWAGAEGLAPVDVRVRFEQGKAVESAAYAATDAADVRGFTLKAFSMGQGTLHLAGDLLLVSSKEKQQRQVSLSADAQVLGRYAAGTATAGDRKGGCLGRLRYETLPVVPMHSAARDWAYTAEPDPALVQAAEKQAQEAIRPGGADGSGFWNWRRLKRNGFRCISAPAFGLVPVEGAVKYRFEIKPKLAPALVFEADKPWVPLSPVWSNVPPGDLTLKVVPLGTNGSPMGGLKWRIRNRLDAGGAEALVDRDTFSFVKCPSFQGPYFAMPADLDAALLKAARAHAEMPSLTGTRGLRQIHETFARGDHGVQRELPAGVFTHLTLFSLSSQDEEKAEALVNAVRSGQAILTARGPTGLTHSYQNHTDVRYRTLEALLDLARITGAALWTNAAMDYAGALCKYQLPSGTWNCIDEQTGKTEKPSGFFKAELLEFCPSQILWQLGRLRAELKTKAFREQERKALAYLRANSLKTFEWPAQGYHSLPLGYPYFTSGNTALAYAFYALDYADSADRDLEEIETILRWVEDHHVQWARIKPASGGQIGPYSSSSADGGRTEGYPIRMGAWQALAWLKLYSYTKQPLHKAKAEALAGAILAAQDPVTGLINWELNATGTDVTHRFNDNYGEAVRDLVEFAGLWKKLR